MALSERARQRPVPWHEDRRSRCVQGILLRFWNLACHDGGRIGVILPRSVLNGKGSSEFRQQAFAGATLEITCVLNMRWWVFSTIRAPDGTPLPLPASRGNTTRQAFHSPARSVCQSGELHHWRPTGRSLVHGRRGKRLDRHGGASAIADREIGGGLCATAQSPTP